MKLVFAIVCIALVSGASSADGDSATTAGSIDLIKAARWFGEFDSLCTREGGALWGISFCGPMLIVDPGTRAVAANRADAGHLLVPRAGVFVGELPAGLPIANTAIEWQGTRWTMIMWWSLGDRQRPRLRLMGHESFHRLQPELGLDTSGELNDHLDTADGRFWIQMEWNALQQALLAEGEARGAAVADALVFRAARRARFPKAVVREIALEINEGLSEFSGMRLVGYSAADVVKVVSAKREEEDGFVRSFAYISGPLYGYLLDAASDGWRRQVTRQTDLGDLLATSMRIGPGLPAPAGAATEQTAARLAAAEKSCAAYGGAALRIAEDAREKERQARLAAWHAALVEGPVLIVELSSVRSSSFDPGKVFPMGDKQTVYTRRELEGEWGVLRIDDGAILEDWNTGEGHVSLSGAAADCSKGDGWTLKLAEGWSVVPAGRAGDLRIVKK